MQDLKQVNQNQFDHWTSVPAGSNFKCQIVVSAKQRYFQVFLRKNLCQK